MKLKAQSSTLRLRSGLMVSAVEPSKLKKTFPFFITCCLLVSLLGCEAFVRKFTRKRPKQELPQEEIVIEPQEYKRPQVGKEELYRQYFLYWHSWHDELLQALSARILNHKKQISCVDEQIKNLQEMRAMLNEDKQKKFDLYLGQLNRLKASIAGDPYGINLSQHHFTAERIGRNLARDFAYRKISKDIVQD